MEYKYHPKTKEELKKLARDESIYLGDIDTSNITDMSDLFNQSNRKYFLGIEKWDTSKVTHMSWMFAGCKEFNQPINFDTSNVKDMHGMFAGCEKFNKPVPFDTSNVEDMGDMFAGCHEFDQPVPFDTSKVNITSISLLNSILLM